MRTEAYLLNPSPIEASAVIGFSIKVVPNAIGKLKLQLRFPVTVVATMGETRGVAPGPIRIWSKAPPMWKHVPGSGIPFPDGTDPSVYVGSGTPSPSPFNVDEYAYATSEDGRYLYVIAGYWDWGNGVYDLNWDQWTSNQIFRWDAQLLEWTRLTPLPGYVGSEGCCGARIGDQIYVLMGDADHNMFNTVNGLFPDPEYVDYELQSLWAYDVTNDTWTRKEQPPFAQDYGACVAFDGKLYAYPGGDYSPSSAPDQAFFVYDPTTGAWTRLSDTPSPGGVAIRNSTPMMWDGAGKIWLAGWPSNYSGSLWTYSYDPSSDTWTDETTAFPSWPMQEASAVVKISDTVVWFIGGRRGSISKKTTEIDVANHTIRDLPFETPDARGWFGGTYYQGVVYVAGARETAPTPAAVSDVLAVEVP